jgi:hypothetical protein
VSTSAVVYGGCQAVNGAEDLGDGLNQAFSEASNDAGSQPIPQTNAEKNTSFLRDFAAGKGWVHKPEPSPETYGVINSDGIFSWRMKIKQEASSREGLKSGGWVPRVSTRLDGGGQHYINPFTGEKVSKVIGDHIPLDQEWGANGR